MDIKPLFPDEMEYPSQELFSKMESPKGFQLGNTSRFGDPDGSATTSETASQLAKTIRASGEYVE